MRGFRVNKSSEGHFGSAQNQQIPDLHGRRCLIRVAVVVSVDFI